MKQPRGAAMNEQTTWMIGWHVLLLGLPLIVIAMMTKDWIAHVHRLQTPVTPRHKKGA
jgi:hypothetical protein